ncbi:MAG TPA: hypothetical protein VK277_05745 [Acidimicrobiales bacterium]|nr:hypothetical protein [Acidimicrobiales bacterium]
MSAGLVLVFEGVDKSHYDKVNELLGIDPTTGTGDWPEGLFHHTAGPTEDGGFVVAELWDSQEHQARFMESRLGPALEQAELPPPVSVTWFEMVASHHP